VTLKFKVLLSFESMGPTLTVILWHIQGGLNSCSSAVGTSNLALVNGDTVPAVRYYSTEMWFDSKIKVFWNVTVPQHLNL
jgi:hypothetical protein